MYTLMIKGKFDSAHYLPEYDGKCQNIHGHTWHITAGFTYKNLYEEGSRKGMGQDFTVLKKQWKVIEEYLDHQLLGDSLHCPECKAPVYLAIDNITPPTAEKLARWIFKRWQPNNPNIAWVEVWETEGAGVRFEPTDRLEIGGLTIDVPKRE